MRSSMVQWTQWFEGKAPKPLDYHAVYHMLAGLAIENLCKGHIVQHLTQDEKNKLERGSLPARLDRKHNFQKLFDDVGFQTLGARSGDNRSYPTGLVLARSLSRWQR